MFYVYILCSLKNGKHYIGHCADIDLRLQRHNKGLETYTKSGIPWELVYKEEYWSRGDAMRRERQLKNLKSHKYIIEHIIGKKNSGGSAAR